MDKLRGLLGIRRMDRVLNARIREFYKVTKGRMERMERMENDRFAKRVYVP